MGYEQPIADADVEGPIRHKLTVEEFLILNEAGVFGDARVELIDGEIFVLSPVHKPHGEVLIMLSYEVVSAVLRLKRGLKCYSPVSTLIDDHNLPEPDISIADDDAGDRFLSPKVTRIAIEVSSSTLRHDLVKKAALYAGAGIPEYWVADVAARRVIRMHEPVSGDYSMRADFTFGDSIPSATIPGLVVDTASL